MMLTSYFYSAISAVILILCLMVLAYRNREAEWDHVWLNCFDGFNRFYCRYFHGLTTERLVIPESGPVVIIANHISGLDPIMLQALSKRPLRFLVAREQYERPVFHWMMKKAGCIPVDRTHNPQQAMREAITALRNGEALAIFPHGGIVYPVQENTRLKGGAVRLAQMQNVPLYPVFFSGIRGAGFTLLAYLLPGRVNAAILPPIQCQNLTYDICMQKVADIINKPQ